MAKSYICLHLDYADNFAPLTDAGVGRVVRALLHYAKTKEMPTKLSKADMLAFIPIKNQIDREMAQYKEVCEKRKKSAEKRWHTGMIDRYPEE